MKRGWKHRENLVEGFTKKYGVLRLVYFELHDRMEQAIVREKAIKKWNRTWQIRMIQEFNPTWRDLYPEIAGMDSRLRGNDEVSGGHST